MKFLNLFTFSRLLCLIGIHNWSYKKGGSMRICCDCEKSQFATPEIEHKTGFGFVRYYKWHDFSKLQHNKGAKK